MSLPTRLGLWRRPDPLSIRVGREGELVTATVRIWVVAAAALIPIGTILFQPPDLEPWVGLACTALALLTGFAVRRLASRPVPPRWLGFFTCVFDVSTVSLMNFGFIAGGQPRHHRLLILHAFLLRTDQQEVEDPQHQEHRNEQTAEGIHGAWAGCLCEGGSRKHCEGTSS